MFEYRKKNPLLFGWLALAVVLLLVFIIGSLSPSPEDEPSTLTPDATPAPAATVAGVTTTPVPSPAAAPAGTAFPLPVVAVTATICPDDRPQLAGKATFSTPWCDYVGEVLLVRLETDWRGYACVRQDPKIGIVYSGDCQTEWELPETHRLFNELPTECREAFADEVWHAGQIMATRFGITTTRDGSVSVEGGGPRISQEEAFRDIEEEVRILYDWILSVNPECQPSGGQ